MISHLPTNTQRGEKIEKWGSMALDFGGLFILLSNYKTNNPNNSLSQGRNKQTHNKKEMKKYLIIPPKIFTRIAFTFGSIHY